MTTSRYVITAEIADREPDGLHPEDSSQVWRSLLTKRTWVVDQSATIGEVMKKVAGSGNVYKVTINYDASEQLW